MVRSNLLVPILWAVLGAGLFTIAVLALPPMPNGWFAKLPSWPVFAALLLLAASLWRDRIARPGRLATVAAFSVLMLFFALTLRAAISDATGVPWVMLGLFPVQDAADYYGEAVGLLTTGVINTVRGRTIHSAILAALLGASGFSLYAVALIQTCAAALATALAGIAFWRNLGAVPALIAVSFLYAFNHYFVGSTMTETTGFVAGTLAFAILCEAVRLDSRSLFLIGLAALSFALSVRVGPLFLLPALILWSGYGFRGARRYDLRVAALALCVVAAVFAANGALNARLAPTSGGSFGNAPDSIYALVAKGKAMLGLRPKESLLAQTRWLQIYADYPELKKLPLEARVARKFEIMYDELLHYPHAAIVGALPEWNNYFFNTQILPFVSSYGNHIARSIAAVLAVIGLIVVCRPRGDRLRGFALAGNLGIFASVPFLIGGETRVYAATMGFTALLAAFGMAFVASRLRRDFQPADDGEAGFAVAPLAAGGIGLMLIPIALGATVYAAAFPPVAAPLACRTDERAMLLRQSAGAMRGTARNGGGLFAAPSVGPGELASRIAAKPTAQLWHATRALARYAAEDQATVYYALDQVASREIALVVPGPPPETSGGVLPICAVFRNGVWVAVQPN